MLMLIKGKKGMMDDFFDLLFTSLALFFIIFFVQVILDTDAETKTDVTLSELHNFENEVQLLHLLDYPISVDGKTQKMKNIILLSVDVHNEALFKEKMRDYFEKNQVEGRIAVYKTKDYLTNKEPLFSFSNVVFSAGKVGEVELLTGNTGQDSITAVLTR